MAMEAEAQVKLAEAEKERAIQKAEAEKERALAEREAAIQLQAEALAKFNRQKKEADRQKKEADRQKKEAEEREMKARGDKLLAEAKAAAEAKMLKFKIEQLERELAKITKKEPGPGQADEDPSDDAADDDDDAVLASTPELLAASLAPAPAPPAEASVDTAVRRELADLAVGLASSQASRAAVERVASTGSANIPSLDRSVSELGMDDLDDIPEADEADYSFRFSQFSGDSQDKKKED